MILLQPYKLRENKLVELKEEQPIKLEWGAYRDLLSPSKTPTAMLLLRKVKVGSFIGLRKKDNGALSNFLYISNNTSESAVPLLRQLPELPNSLHSLYKVLAVDFGSRFKE